MARKLHTVPSIRLLKTFSHFQIPLLLLKPIYSILEISKLQIWELSGALFVPGLCVRYCKSMKYHRLRSHLPSGVYCPVSPGQSQLNCLTIFLL